MATKQCPSMTDEINKSSVRDGSLVVTRQMTSSGGLFHTVTNDRSVTVWAVPDSDK